MNVDQYTFSWFGCFFYHLTARLIIVIFIPWITIGTFYFLQLKARPTLEISVQLIVIWMFYFLHLTVGSTREVCVSLPDPCPPLVIHWRQQDEGKDGIWRFHPWYHHHPSTASTDYTYHRLWGEFSSMMTFNYWCKLIDWFGNMQFLIHKYWILVIHDLLKP